MAISRTNVSRTPRGRKKNLGVIDFTKLDDATARILATFLYKSHNINKTFEAGEHETRFQTFTLLNLLLPSSSFNGMPVYDVFGSPKKIPLGEKYEVIGRISHAGVKVVFNSVAANENATLIRTHTINPAHMSAQEIGYLFKCVLHSINKHPEKQNFHTGVNFLSDNNAKTPTRIALNLSQGIWWRKAEIENPENLPTFEVFWIEETLVAQKFKMIGLIREVEGKKQFELNNSKTIIKSNTIDPLHMSFEENQFLYHAIYTSLENRPEKQYFSQGTHIIQVENGKQEIKIQLDISRNIWWRRSENEIRFLNVDSEKWQEITNPNPQYTDAPQLKGRIEIEDVQLGNGAFGSVYRTRTGKPQSDHIFALKTKEINNSKKRVPAYRAVKKLKRRFHGNPARIEAAKNRFFNNAVSETELTKRRYQMGIKHLMAKAHPNAAEAFMVMHLLEGQTWNSAKPSNTQEILLNALFAFYDLEKMHRSNIIHRDIKPENIMINPGFPPTVTIYDNGLAKDNSGTRTHEKVGSPLYMPPEGYFNQPTNESSDRYSLLKTIAINLGAKEETDNPIKSCELAKYLKSKDFLDNIVYHFNIDNMFKDIAEDLSDEHKATLINLIQKGIHNTSAISKQITARELQEAANARPTTSTCIQTLLTVIVEDRLAHLGSNPTTTAYIAAIKEFHDILSEPLNEQWRDLFALTIKLNQLLQNLDFDHNFVWFKELSGIHCIQHSETPEELIKDVTNILLNFNSLDEEIEKFKEMIAVAMELINSFIPSLNNPELIAEIRSVLCRGTNLNRVINNVIERIEYFVPLNLDSMLKANHMLQKDIGRLKPFIEKFREDALEFAKKCCAQPAKNADKSCANNFLMLFHRNKMKQIAIRKAKEEEEMKKNEALASTIEISPMNML